EAERCEENQAASGHPGLPRTFDQQRVTRDNRRNAPAERVNRADKRQDECKGTEYIHGQFCLSPGVSRAPYMPLFSVGLGAAPPLPPGAASYLEAHFACTTSATNRPSGPGRPSTRAWDLSTNVSGRGSVPM